MILQITDFGVSVLSTNPSPQLDTFRVGSAFGYVPLPTDTAVHGSVLYAGLIAPPVILNANTVKYVISMDNSVGDFDWGEIGYFYQGQLFALAVSDSTTEKRKVGGDAGNVVRIDAYLTLVGTNYAMIVDQADTSNQFMMASLSTVDQLPPVNSTLPNAYIISAAAPNQTSFQAITDRSGLWAFDAYQFADSATSPILSADNQSVTIGLADFSEQMNPAFFGQVVLQFSTGSNFSICRYVSSAIQSGSQVTLGFQTPMAVIPKPGDRFRSYRRVSGASELEIPIATASVLGGIRVGSGLTVDPLTGIASVDSSALAPVTSVNNKQGIVVLTAQDIPGFAAVATSGSYNDLIDKPAAYSLPVATTSALGGVRAPATNNLIINSQGVIELGFAPVKTINGVGPDAAGNINVTSGEIGLIAPQAVPTGADLNSYYTTGLFTVGASVTLSNRPLGSAGFSATLEVVPTSVSGTGYSIQRYTNAAASWWRAGSEATWGFWVQVATSAVATTTSLGLVKIGSGLSIAADGTLSVPAQTLPVATTTSLGVVQIGSGLAVTAEGVLSSTYSLPIASATTLGGVRIGSGLTVDGLGVVRSNILTVNGNLPDANGNVVGSDDLKLNRINGVATGIRYTDVNLGVRASGSGMPVVVSNGNSVGASFTGGTITWSFNGWPATGYTEVQVELTNAGLATHSFPSAVQFVNPDGSITTLLSAYLTLQRGTSNFNSAGKDFVCFWSRDGGTNIYCKVM